jgi:hypothetical protein
VVSGLTCAELARVQRYFLPGVIFTVLRSEPSLVPSEDTEGGKARKRSNSIPPYQRTASAETVELTGQCQVSLGSGMPKKRMGGGE